VVSATPFKVLYKDDCASVMIACYELNNEKPMVELFICSYIRSCEQFLGTAIQKRIESFSKKKVSIEHRAF
jgi:hypothetical protein